MPGLISPESFQQLVDAFRARGWGDASYGEISRVTGIHYHTVSKLWKEGRQPSKCYSVGYPAIRKIALEESRTGKRYYHPGVPGAVKPPAAPGAVKPPTGPAAPAASAPTPTPEAPVLAPGVVVPAPAALVPTYVAPPPAAFVPDHVALVPPPPPAPPRAINPNRITREDIEDHAQEALAAELRAIAAVRDGAVGAAVSVRKMLGALQGRLDLMEQQIQEEDERGDAVNPIELSKIMHRVLIVASKASEITKQCIESERLALGSPTEIIKVLEAPSASAPQTDAAAEAATRADKVLDFLSRRRRDKPAALPIETKFIDVVDTDDGDEQVEAETKEVESGDPGVAEADTDEVESDPTSEVEALGL